jgi:hypothetical protein
MGEEVGVVDPELEADVGGGDEGVLACYGGGEVAFELEGVGGWDVGGE